MKITIRELKQLIKEQVEEASKLNKWKKWLSDLLSTSDPNDPFSNFTDEDWRSLKSKLDYPELYTPENGYNPGKPKTKKLPDF